MATNNHRREALHFTLNGDRSNCSICDSVRRFLRFRPCYRKRDIQVIRAINVASGVLLAVSFLALMAFVKEVSTTTLAAQNRSGSYLMGLEKTKIAREDNL